jgi:hypothetical protein
MLNCPDCVDNALPQEYRACAGALFPHDGYTAGNGPSTEAIRSFAQLLGVDNEYPKYLESLQKEDVTFMASFQHNLKLLIQKTWVEKSDVYRKEKLLTRVPEFVKVVENKDYATAITDFGNILGEVAYLLFGAQSTRDDFTEYTFRIDGQMGLFWWYGSRLVDPHIKDWTETADPTVLSSLLLLGICYLTNF